ncbi:MAG: M1 family aminopeptidase, partial [Desulfobacteraceae bacterium]|nr:M1 family aminopeptidase [Desulfobacteraceae bacterium]
MAAHDLRIELILDEGRLVGHDRLRLAASQRGALVFRLSPGAENLRVLVNGRPRRFSRRTGTLRVTLTPEERGRPVDVDLFYQAVFDDPFPANPYNTDNPGFGVAGTISAAGVFLLDGAGWYPDLADSRPTFALEVKAPAGILAVTAGRNLGHQTTDGASISRWHIDHPVRGLALSAAAYQVAERRLGETVVATYFRQGNLDLSPAYLEAAAGYLEFYQERFGPYPFPKFAVVENFFPTGYGFASYTLIGESVLRLPFIIATSLGHEIAHCWWGNGVWVDFTGGNWSEGLTTYVAEYLYQERISAAAARQAREQMLRHYTTLVPPENDFPLSRFVGRRDPVTKAVGYDKGAMVFHMLRREVGDDHFWSALRDLFASHCFRPASWEDIRQAMERRAGRPLEWFFDQWVRQPGAPRLGLESVGGRPENGAWQVKGRLRQQPSHFRATWDLVLETAAGAVEQPLELDGAVADFQITASRKPTTLLVDPEAHALRRLAPNEIPPAVNAIKASPAVTVVLCDSRALDPRRLADILVRSLGIAPRATVV